jgi:hypothetical protein
MAAGKLSFIIEQGSTLSLGLTYTDATGSYIDLSRFGGRMQIRPDRTSEDVYITLSSSLQPDGTGLNFSGSNGNTDPRSGSICIFISAVSSSLLDFNQAVYDLELHSGSFVERLLEGNVQLSKNVTR